MGLIHIYKKIIIDPSKSWVLFKNGTCVMLLTPEEDVQSQAIKILKEHGSVVAGTPSGDFEVTKIPEINGWVITGDHPGVMMYISQEEAGSKKNDFEIGMLGRRKRELDAKELEVVHVEDKRKSI
jgi:hypothetical protein